MIKIELTFNFVYFDENMNHLKLKIFTGHEHFKMSKLIEIQYLTINFKTQHLFE